MLWLPPDQPRFTPKRVDFSGLLDSLCSPRNRSSAAGHVQAMDKDQQDLCSDLDGSVANGQSDGQSIGPPDQLLSFTNKPQEGISVIPNRDTLTESEISIRDGTNQNAVIKATLVFGKFDQISQNFPNSRKVGETHVLLSSSASF